MSGCSSVNPLKILNVPVFPLRNEKILFVYICHQKLTKQI